MHGSMNTKCIVVGWSICQVSVLNSAEDFHEIFASLYSSLISCAIKQEEQTPIQTPFQTWM
jgi:hypothetical protein